MLFLNSSKNENDWQPNFFVQLLGTLFCSTKDLLLIHLPRKFQAGLPKFCQVLPNFAKLLQVYTSLHKIRIVLPSLAKFSHFVAKFIQVQPTLSKFRQLQSSIVQFIKVQPSLAKLSQVQDQPNLAKLSQVQPIIANLSKVLLSLNKLNHVQPILTKCSKVLHMFSQVLPSLSSLGQFQNISDLGFRDIKSPTQLDLPNTQYLVVG